MSVFVHNYGPFVEEAVVFDVLDRSFNVLITRLSVEERVLCEQMSFERFSYLPDEK